MKIGLLGAGHIGKTLALKLSNAGHDVKVANSRGPETIDPEILKFGAQAVTSAEGVKDVDIIIISVNPKSFSQIAPLLVDLPKETVIIDTSNYHPGRDGKIAALEEGQVESLWVQEQLSRPIVKAWNTIVSDSVSRKGKPKGSSGRIALTVSADNDRQRAIGMKLVEETGFDAFDAGIIKDSWRQQPGSPVYCTDLTIAQIPAALASAERERLPKRRQLITDVLAERFDNLSIEMNWDFFLHLSRLISM